MLLRHQHPWTQPRPFVPAAPVAPLAPTIPIPAAGIGAQKKQMLLNSASGETKRRLRKKPRDRKTQHVEQSRLRRVASPSWTQKPFVVVERKSGGRAKEAYLLANGKYVVGCSERRSGDYKAVISRLQELCGIGEVPTVQEAREWLNVQELGSSQLP